MVEATRLVTVTHAKGLHARPAMAFTTLAMRFESIVTVGRPDNGASVDGKSMMGMLTLMITAGTVIRIDAEGNDAVEAVAALVEFLERGCPGAS